MIERAARCRSPMRRRRIDWDADVLRRLRVEERRSFPHIASMFGCHHTSVIWACKRLGIPDVGKPRRVARRKPQPHTPSLSPGIIPAGEQISQSQEWNRLMAGQRF